MVNVQVKFAVYGGLRDGNQDQTEAADVGNQLQVAFDNNPGAIVAINNDTFNVDPAPNVVKHFGAIVTVDGTDYYFACQEGQTVNFLESGSF